MNVYILTHLGINLAVLLFAWALYARGRREQFRCEVRQIRDGLFDFMWQNGHSFDDGGYRATREMLNGVLRLSNTLSLFQLLWMIHLHFRWKPTEDARNSGLCASSNEQIDQALERVKRETAERIVRFACFQGVTGILARLAYCAFALVRRASDAKAWAAKQGRLLVHDAALLSPSANHRGTWYHQA